MLILFLFELSKIGTGMKEQIKVSNTFSFSRKLMKQDARNNLKRHYLFFVVVCLVSLMVQAEFVTTDYVIKLRSQFISDVVEAAQGTFAEETVTQVGEKVNEAGDDYDTFYQAFGDALEDISTSNGYASDVFGRSKGVINSVINYLASDTFLSHAYTTIYSIVGSDSLAETILIAGMVWFSALFWFFVRNLYIAICRRIILEGRVYKKIPFSRFVFFIRARKWSRAALAMFLMVVLDSAAASTIFLGPVCYYGLFLMPFIIAENPWIRPVQAAKMSWNMMRGNKLELFKLELSMLGWNILGIMTLGILNVFYVNPYRVCIYAEFYAKARESYRKQRGPGYELLADKYLFAKADSDKLADAYADVIEEVSKPEYELAELKGRKKFIAEHFGVVLRNTKDEQEYEESEAKRVRMLGYKDEAEGEMYPSRLSIVPDKKKFRSLAHIHYMRHYSLLSLIVLFFIFSGFGWVWELIYYYIKQGRLINRGVLHGPWLPIYGLGGMMVLIFLYSFRKNPFVHFWMTVLVCGAFEYFGGWALEEIYHEKWWDYTGYFLNLNGRICAEGLFVFGVCGLAFIYVLAPLLDDQIRKWNKKIVIPVCAVLIAFFLADMVYSRFVPNTGSGVTGDFEDEITQTQVSQTIDESELM